MVRTRPKTRRALQVKTRRCTKCGCALNNQLTRCKRCSSVQKFKVS